MIKEAIVEKLIFEAKQKAILDCISMLEYYNGYVEDKQVIGAINCLKDWATCEYGISFDY